MTPSHRPLYSISLLNMLSVCLGLVKPAAGQPPAPKRQQSDPENDTLPHTSEFWASQELNSPPTP
jgi:hypothetical protein